MFKKEKNDNSDQIKQIVEKNKITLIENRGKVELNSEKLKRRERKIRVIRTAYNCFIFDYNIFLVETVL